MKTVKVLEAKTHLSDLLREVEAGEEIVIARGNTPVARLVAVESGPRELGFVSWSLPSSFFDDLPDDELEAWEGEG
ncbi:prevent-host-death family protein [Knoellia remsis]|jgi:prevent-host-death family protein|uniref:Antitoxin n=1 Tax=Knoellia remsis TaxID=407159 RepID=A0A2T0UGW0_9MICO|nr:type II toxin-antitoxin system prevent-host-death family antitoxin [Knoellia remsis]PRY57057.1 prevent-host-death family protein [Knoellia remsis]